MDYVRFDANRRVAQSKAVLKASSNLQLITLSQRNDRLLFSTYGCDTQARSLYDIALTDPNASPRLIATNLNVSDADYDYKSNAILVLTSPVTSQGSDYTVVSIDSATLQQTVRWQRPASWKSASLNPQRLRALTGGEMMIAAEGSGKFVVARVSEDGSTSGGITGDGKIISFDISILQEQIALSFEPSAQYDLYLCSFNVVYRANTTPIATTGGCSGSQLPEALIGGTVRVAWAFGPGGGNTDALLAVRGETYLLEVEGLDPPRILSTTRVDGLTAYYATSVYVVEKDLYPTLPGVAL